MTYADIIGTAALVAALVAIIFAYVAIPPVQRAQGWAILGSVGVVAFTLVCIWLVKDFISQDSVPSRKEIAELVLYMIGSLGGWLLIFGFIGYAAGKRWSRD